MKVLKNEPLKQHTSFRVGGPAKVYVVPEDIEELQKLIRFLYEEKLPYDIIGNGTNLLVSDAGVDHVVVEIGRALEGIELLPEANASDEKTYYLRVLAGTLLSKAAQFAATQELSGMEALRGIPGTLGGAVTMNAGAYGTEMKDVLYSVDVLTPEGKLRTLTPAELELGYRHSVIPERGYIAWQRRWHCERETRQKSRRGWPISRTGGRRNSRSTRPRRDRPSSGRRATSPAS